MGLFTPLTLPEARRLGAEYGLEVVAVKALAAGSVNSNFSLRTADGAVYFARIYEEQDESGAAAELRLLDELAEAGVPVVKPLPRQARPGPASIRGKPFAAYPWVTGEILCQGRVRPVHAEQVGRALARLHLATPRLGALPDGRFRIDDLKARLDRIDREAPEYAGDVRFIRERLEHYAVARDPELPQGIIHGDLFRDNVLWRGDDIAALIDFESASRGTFAFDLSVCLLAWCYGSELDRELAGAMLSGYHAVRALTAAEKRALRVEGAVAALRFATTRITDFSMRTPAGERPKRDYRRFLARLAALEAGVLEELLRML